MRLVEDNGGMGSLYRSQHELFFVSKAGTAPHINNVELGKHGRYRTNVWSYAGANSFSATRDDDLGAHPGSTRSRHPQAGPEGPGLSGIVLLAK